MTKADRGVPRNCSVEGCVRPYSAKGYCLRHYQRERRKALAAEGRSPDPNRHVKQKLLHAPNGDCVEGCGAKATRGTLRCDACAARKAESERAKKARRRAAGICTKCGAECFGEAPTCRRHWFKVMANAPSYRFAVTADELEAIWVRQGGRCVYSGKPLVAGVNASLDHIVPRTKNGGRGAANLQWVDRVVNCMKTSFGHGEFIAMCRLIAGRFARRDNPATPQLRLAV